MTRPAASTARTARKRRPLLAGLAALTAAAISILGVSLPAQASSGDAVTYHPVAGGEATITLDHSTYEPGDTVQITGTGFVGTTGDGSGVQIVVKPDDDGAGWAIASFGGADATTPAIANHATFSSHADGTFSGTVTLPSSLPSGAHWLRFLAGTYGTPTTPMSFKADFTVPAPLIAPTITTQPAAATVDAGHDATFAVAASGNPTPTVQWQSSPDGSNWTDVDGATSQTLTIPHAGSAASGTQYHAVFTNSEGSATTDAAALTVNVPTPQVTLDASSYAPGATVQVSGTGFIGKNGLGGVNVVVKPDDDAFATASYGGADAVVPSAAGTRATFASHDDGTFTGTVTLPDNLAASGPGTGDHAGQHWLRFLAGTYGNPINAASIPVYFTVVATAAPAITTQPSNATIVAGDTATFTAAASGTPAPTVQWQSSTDGTNWTDIDGATSATLSIPSATVEQSGTSYRAVFTNSVDSVTTSTATLTVNASGPQLQLDRSVYHPGDTLTATLTGVGSYVNTTLYLSLDDQFLGAHPNNAKGNIRVTANPFVKAYILSDPIAYNGDHLLELKSGGPTGTTIATAHYTIEGGTDAEGFYLSTVGGYSAPAADGSLLVGFNSAPTFTIAAGYGASPNTTYTLYSGDDPVLDGADAPIVVTTDGRGFSANTAAITAQQIGLTSGGTAALSLRGPDGQHLGNDKELYGVTLSTDATFSIDKSAYEVGDTIHLTGDGWMGRTDTITPSVVDLGLETADGTHIALSDTATAPVPSDPTILATGTASTASAADLGKLSVDLPLSTDGLTPALTDGWYRLDISTGRTPANSMYRNLTSDWFKIGNPTGPAPGETVWTPEGTKHTFTAADGQISVWYPETVPAGGTMTIYGEGWLNTAQTAGSTIAIKLAHNGQFVNATSPVYPSNTSVWSIGNAEATNGRWSATFTLPTSSTSDQNWNQPGERVSFQLLTGSLQTGDVVRSYAGYFNVAFDPSTGTAPTFTTQPPSLTVAQGDPANITVAASGDPAPSYLWQTNNGSGWTDPQDYQSATRVLIASATVSDSGLQYRAIAQNSAGQAVSEIGTLTVTSSDRPAITAQPTSTTVLSGGTASFAAAASGTPMPTVQWQSSTDGTTWVNIAGATSTTLTLANASTGQDGTQYHAVFTNSAGTATTNAATLTVVPAPSNTRTYTGISDPSVTFTAPTAVVQGDQIIVSGTGWKTTDGSLGSVVAVKYDDGAISATFPVTNPKDSTTIANTQVFAAAYGDANGDWTMTIPYPTTSNSSLTSEWAVGSTHSVRLLTGSLETGDKVRTETASFTITDGSEAGSTRTYTGSSDPSVTFTAPTAVVEGDQIIVTGTGWKTTDGSLGSVVAVKYDDGAISATFPVTNPKDSTTIANTQVFAAAYGDADGDWTMAIPYPTTSNSSLTSEWAVGSTHSVRLLTGSLETGDKIRTETASFTIVAPGTSCAADETLVSDTAGGQTATACIQQDVTTGAGSTIHVTGHGWLTEDGTAGSTVVLKLASRADPTAADFQFVHTGASGDDILSHPVNHNADPTIWAIVQADANGDFDTTIPMPVGANVPGNIDADAGALAAGHKLVVHFQSGLLDTDTQHTVDSDSLVVDGAAYPGDQDGAVTECTPASGGYEAHLVTPDGQTENATTGPVVDYGQTLHLVGTGWCNADPAKGGSTIAIKIDDGAYSHRTGELVNANPQVWQIIEVNSADGSFDATITLPNEGDVAGGTTPAFAEGVHTLRLLTGSLKAGDPIRTLQTGNFTVGAYQPNGIPDPVEAHEDLTDANRHGVTASVGDSDVTVTIPGAHDGDWAFLTAYLSDGSVRYPWAATWFQTDGDGVVRASLSGATLPVGTWKLAVQGPDSGLLGWATVTVTAPPSDPGNGGAGDGGGGTTPVSIVHPGVINDPATTTSDTPAPTSTPEPPVTDSTGLTAANAGGVTGTQDGSVVTVTLPDSVKPGDWVFLYVYSTPTAVGWVQADDNRQVKVDLSLMDAGIHKIAVLDMDGKLIGWTSATVAQQDSHTPAGTSGDAADTGSNPVNSSTSDPGGFTSTDGWLIAAAVLLLLILAAIAVIVIRRRRSSGEQSAA